MPRQKRHRDRVSQRVSEPDARASSDAQDEKTLATQKHVITEFARRKGWEITRWYEEPARSAKKEMN